MKVNFGIITILVTCLFHNCAPVFSDLQSARLVGKKNVEVTPSYSTVAFTEDRESEGIQNHIGAQVAVGLSDKVDLRIRLEHIWVKDDSFSEQVFGVGPKISLAKDRVAAYLPVGFALSDIGGSFEFHPTLLFTLPVVQNQIDFNPAAKYLIAFCEDCENLLAFNLGLALSNDLSKWAFRTEYGFLINPGESGSYRHFTVGFSFTFNKKSQLNE